ncbi:MAG: adenylate/guanylate cyclase domain-containing protein [Geminicoccales bacterium]
MPESSSTPTNNPWRLPISTLLGLGLGGLVSVVLALLLWITLGAVFKNTTELLSDKSRIFLEALTTQTSRYLDATLAPSNVIAGQISRGTIDPRETDGVETLLRTLLAATPQVDVLAFFDVNGTRISASRSQGEILSRSDLWPERVEIKKAMEDVRTRRSSMWGPPVYSPNLGTFLNYRRPVFVGETFLGMVTALVTIRTLSDFLGSLETETGQNAFILYDRTHVLAHLNLAGGFDGLREDRPLPRVTEVGDPVLFNIWQDGWQESQLVAGSGHAGESANRDYIFLYTPLEDYADAPWLVGSYFSADAIDIQFERMMAAAVASSLLVLLTLFGTYFLGRLLRRPINQLAEAATAVQKLDLDGVPALPRSHFAELDDASRAFNAMASALRAFSHYVPKDLVSRLIMRGDIDDLTSEARDVTVLMTDIVGFTARAEQLSASATASFLNHHLGLVTHAIEAEGGIVDKYMGDAVMALWGAIDDEPDHAARAIAAAIRIQDAVHRDNIDRSDQVRLRVGLHSGPVIAGNIGTATRMNYTVVGDTVNLAQRLEVLGKDLLPDQEVAVLMSAETAKAAPNDIQMLSLGHHGMRGREQPIEIFTFQ